MALANSAINSIYETALEILPEVEKSSFPKIDPEAENDFYENSFPDNDFPENEPLYPMIELGDNINAKLVGVSFREPFVGSPDTSPPFLAILIPGHMVETNGLSVVFFNSAFSVINAYIFFRAYLFCHKNTLTRRS